MGSDTLLELNKVNLVYRALPALEDISWQFLQGQQWACMGPNGAGKTSQASILSDQTSHYSGAYHRSGALQQQGIAYVCFEQAKALCERDKKLDDSD